MNQRPVVLYFNGTFVHHQNGAHARVAALLKFLVDCGCQVTVYSFADHPDCPWGKTEIALFSSTFPTVRLVLDRRPGPLRYWIKAKKLLTSIMPSITPTLLSWNLPGATPNYDRLKAELSRALYFVNYANGLVELNGVDPGSSVVETHDLDFLQFSKRYGHSLSSRKIASKYRSEISLLESASALIGIAPSETGLFRLCFPEKTVFFVPDYGVTEVKHLNAPSQFDYDMLFVGSENRFNVHGIIAFIEEHKTFLTSHPLAIAGEVSIVPDVIAAASTSTNISLLGYVDDIDDLYRRSKIVISPVEGTGLKIKVVEALAAGKPVFGSQHTIDGLPPGSDACVFALNTTLMSAMLADATLLASTGNAGRLFAKELSQKGDAEKLRSFLMDAGCRPDKETHLTDALNVSSRRISANTP